MSGVDIKTDNFMNGSGNGNTASAALVADDSSCCADAVYSVCCCPVGLTVLAVCGVSAIVSIGYDLCTEHDYHTVPCHYIGETFNAMALAPWLKCKCFMNK